jgi:hypothetical protein
MGFRVSSFSVAFGLVLSLSFLSEARARESSALDQMVQLNKKALAAFKSGKHSVARTHLLDAVVIGKQNGLGTHDMAARSYLHLGVVHIAGLKERDKAMRYFAVALKLRPSIQLTPAVATKETKQAFEEARRSAGEPVADVGPPPPKSDEPSEPRRTAKVAQPLYCPTPDEGPPKQKINLHCHTQPGIKAKTVRLYYRPSGGKRYAALSMARTKPGLYSGVIPASAATGKSIQFYVEARGAGGKLAATSGQKDLPNVLVLRPGAAPVAKGSRVAARDSRGEGMLAKEESSESTVKARDLDTNLQAGRRNRRPARAVWIGLGLGSGFGWHLARSLEADVDKRIAPGFSGGGLGYVSPEVGVQWDERLAFSVQTRHQYVPVSGSGDPDRGSPPTSAHAVLARAYLSLWERQAVQVLGTGTLGGGSALRLKVPPSSGWDRPQSDTISSGPVVLGPGAACFYNLGPKLTAVAELKMLVGVWKFAAALDVAAGAQYTF